MHMIYNINTNDKPVKIFEKGKISEATNYVYANYKIDVTEVSQ